MSFAILASVLVAAGCRSSTPENLPTTTIEWSASAETAASLGVVTWKSSAINDTVTQWEGVAAGGELLWQADITRSSVDTTARSFAVDVRVPKVAHLAWSEAGLIDRPEGSLDDIALALSTSTNDLRGSDKLPSTEGADSTPTKATNVRIRTSLLNPGGSSLLAPRRRAASLAAMWGNGKSTRRRLLCAFGVLG